uniref:Uncharacterized protein LOC100175252 n=1 Tax=Phallusia mammillata TaxID=59560 RepID=A0A6F9DGQ8_9ASCI|nr:uncharacterized protein LOC100175252 [Phallusia mammillata]
MPVFHQHRNKNLAAGIFSKIVQFFVLAILALPVSLCYIVLQLCVWKELVRLRFAPKREAEFANFNGGRMTELNSVSTKVALDFKKKRSPCYTKQLTFGCLWEFSKLASNSQNIPLVPDDVLYHVLRNTVFAHGMERGDPSTDILWRLPINIDNYKLFKGCYWDIREIRLHREYKISLVDRVGGVHTPLDKTWRLAKAHAQALLTFYAPGLAHNTVHFVFPSLVAGKVRTVLPPSSVLRQLLEPHTKYTEYINYQALHECQSSTNTGTLTDRVFKPWLSFPIRNDDFLQGIQDHCEKCYYDEMLITQELTDDLHYHSFLKQYYDVVRDFVNSLEPLIVDDYVHLASSIQDHLPSVKRHNPVDVISTMLWNCAIVHYCDHQGFLKHFANKYGCITIRTPLVPPDSPSAQPTDASKSAPNGVINTSHPVPSNENFFTGEDVYHTRCFLRCFVRYNENTQEDMTLPLTKYDFDDELATAASDQFFRDLVDLDSKLRQRGEAVVPYSQFVRSVCF